MQEEIKNIKNIVEMGKLKTEERRELEKLLEKLQGILRVKMDDRISEEKVDDVEVILKNLRFSIS